MFHKKQPKKYSKFEKKSSCQKRIAVETSGHVSNQLLEQIIASLVMFAVILNN